MLGDGSDGHLHVLSGQTVSLLLNHKYQYKSITVDAGGTLTTSSTTGAVLFLLSQGTVTINGTINLSGKLDPGDFWAEWETTIDGHYYYSPGTASGGTGTIFSGQTQPPQYKGFGSGGSGDDVNAAENYNYQRAVGGTGGYPGGSGGAGVAGDTGNTASRSYSEGGFAGGASSGGGGGTYVSFVRTAGDVVGRAIAYGSGAGGSAYGANGTNGQNPAGSVSVVSGSGSYSYNFYSMGGGGAGGIAGRGAPNLHLKAPIIRIAPTAVINLSGTNGGAGGNGGRTYIWNGELTTSGGLGGGGGGGGWGGDFDIYYGAEFTYDPAFPGWNLSAGSGGAAGARPNGGTIAGAGGNGVAGTITINRAPVNEGNFISFF